MNESTTPASMPTHVLLDALRDHYIKPGELRPGAVLLTEVTAPDRVHRADAIHVGLWASRGYTVDVHELKTSHADFKRELDKPAKAEAWWRHSSTFWIVAPSTAVAPPEMLPAGWGLMVPGGRGRRFRTVVKAEYRELRPSTALMAALLTSTETDRTNAVWRERERLNALHYKEMQDAVRKAAISGLSPNDRARLGLLDALEQMVGFELNEYDFGSENVSLKTMAAALREVLVEKKTTRGVEHVLDDLDAEAERLKQAVAKARKDFAETGVVSPELAQAGAS